MLDDIGDHVGLCSFRRQVGLRKNAFQTPVGIHNTDSPNLRVSHQCRRFAQRGSRGKRLHLGSHGIVAVAVSRVRPGAGQYRGR